MPSRLWMLSFLTMIFLIGLGRAVGYNEEPANLWFGVPMATVAFLLALRTLMPAVRVVGDEVRIYHPADNRKRVPISDISHVTVEESSGTILPIVLPCLVLNRDTKFGMPEEVPIMMGASYPTPWGTRAVHRRAQKWAAQIGVPLKLGD